MMDQINAVSQPSVQGTGKGGGLIHELVKRRMHTMNPGKMGHVEMNPGSRPFARLNSIGQLPYSKQF